MINYVQIEGWQRTKVWLADNKKLKIINISVTETREDKWQWLYHIFYKG